MYLFYKGNAMKYETFMIYRHTPIIYTLLFLTNYCIQLDLVHALLIAQRVLHKIMEHSATYSAVPEGNLTYLKR